MLLQSAGLLCSSGSNTDCAVARRASTLQSPASWLMERRARPLGIAQLRTDTCARSPCMATAKSDPARH